MEKYLELEEKKQTLSRVKIPGQNASLLLTAFPGRTSANTFSTKKMSSVFNLLEKEGCSHFLSLVEDDEFDDYCGKALLEAEAEKKINKLDSSSNSRYGHTKKQYVGRVK